MNIRCRGVTRRRRGNNQEEEKPNQKFKTGVKDRAIRKMLRCIFAKIVCEKGTGRKNIQKNRKKKTENLLTTVT